MDGQRVDYDYLPSHGIVYPDDIEIYVKPLSVKEQIDINTRQYAKRQDTWFNNRYKEFAHFVDVQKPMQEVLDDCLKLIKVF